MSEREAYEPGVPCWVDNLVPDLAGAQDFYGQLLGWEFDGPGPGEYHEALLRGRKVAGLGAQPPGVPPAWNTYISVANADAAADTAAAAGGRIVVAPLDALPAGRVAVVEDPSGAAIGLWEPVGRQGAQLVNEPSAWAMSVLHTPDPDTATRFYRQVFGWGTEAFAPRISVCRLAGYVGGEPAQPVPRDVVAAIAASDGPAQWRVDFWVSDADALAESAPGLGGRVLVAPFDAGPMRQAVLADPAGAAFSITTAPGR